MDSLFEKVRFVKPVGDAGDIEQVKSPSNGQEIREFYEDLIKGMDRDRGSNKIKDGSMKLNGQEQTGSTDSRAHLKNRKIREIKRNIKCEDIFKFSQDNQVHLVDQWLSSGFDINTIDIYGWTPLMCAACAGSNDVVQLLLKNNARTDIKSKKGLTALELALKNGHYSIIESIINKKKSKICKIHQKSEETKMTKSNDLDNYCESCNLNYKDPEPSHLTTIVHNINTYQPKNRTYYGIPESNKGFQMLKSSGWDKEKGLGPDEDGRKFPVKTILKRDRQGFGTKSGLSLKPRITHFGPYDEQSVERKRYQKLKINDLANIKKKEKREKRIEINFRRQFNS